MRPAGLKYDDRLAPDPSGAGFWFLCQRSGHGVVSKFIPGLKRDGEAFRSAHDTAQHNAMLREAGLRAEPLVTVHRVIAEFLEHVRELEAEGTTTAQTTEHYEYTTGILKRGFKPRETLGSIDPARVSRFVHWAKKDLNTGGAAIVKALQTLRTLFKSKAITPRWSIPYKDIKPQKLEVRDLTPDLVARFVKKLPKGSLERAVVALKMRTGIRNVEIYELRVEDVDLQERLIEPMLHAKVKTKPHVYPLTDDLVKILRPLVKGRRPDDYVFTIEGRKLRKESLRTRFVNASTAAKISPPIRSIKQIRAEVVTVVTDETDLSTASKWIGHESEKTTKKWYYRDRMTAAKLESSRRVAEILASAFPL